MHKTRVVEGIVRYDLGVVNGSVQSYTTLGFPRLDNQRLLLSMMQANKITSIAVINLFRFS